MGFGKTPTGAMRLQGTILHEHWRVAFRRRYSTSRRQLQESLDAFLLF